MIGLAVGTLFTAKILLNPFYSSFNPGEHAKAGPLRWLPIERTLLNDLPVSADAARARRSARRQSSHSGVFHGRQCVSAGGGRILGERRVPRGCSAACAADARRRRARRVAASSRAQHRGHQRGAANRVVISGGWDRVRLDLAPGEVRVVQVSAGAGVPYKPSRFPTNFVYGLSISSSAGFVPFLHDSSNPDSRYLGALVRVVPIYFNP